MSFKVKASYYYFIEILAIIIVIILQFLPAGIEHLGVGRPGLRPHDGRQSSIRGKW
jgi:hypothetical protein